MKLTPYAAFGTVVLISTVDAGETQKIILGTDGFVQSGYYYQTLGATKSMVTATNEILEDRTPGWLNTEHEMSNASSGGELTVSFSEKSEWICIPHSHNPKGLPKLRSLIIKNGEEASIVNGTNLFLARGTLSINDKVFVGPRQLRIRSSDVTAKASEDCYSLIFE